MDLPQPTRRSQRLQSEPPVAFKAGRITKQTKKKPAKSCAKNRLSKKQRKSCPKSKKQKKSSSKQQLKAVVESVEKPLQSDQLEAVVESVEKPLQSDKLKAVVENVEKPLQSDQFEAVVESVEKPLQSDQLKAVVESVETPLQNDQLMTEWQGRIDPAEVEHPRIRPDRPSEGPARPREHEEFEGIVNLGPDVQAQELICLKKELEETKKKLQEKTQELDDLEDEMERQTTQLTLDKGDLIQKVEDLRNFMLSSNGEGRWGPEDDGDIRLSVCHLQKALKSWAKRRCPKSFKQRQISYLSHMNTQPSMKIIRQVADFTTFASVLRFDALYLVLAAVLSEFIRTNILSKPFFHLQNASQSGASNSFAVNATQMLEMWESDDPEEAIAWRAQTIRNVFPVPGHSVTMRAIHTRDPICPKGTTHAQACTMYRDLADEFLRGPCAQIFKEELTKDEVSWSDEHLYELMVMAGNIHFCLMTQKSKLVWAQPKPYLGRPFSVYSSLYNPGSALCMHSEDESNEGKAIQVVFGASLVGYGDFRGHNLEHRRIIVGASVYLNQKRPAVSINSQQEPEIIGGSDRTPAQSPMTSVTVGASP